MNTPTTPGGEAFRAEFERRWRERIDTNNPYDINPHTRVGRNEMADWSREHGFDFGPMLQDVEPLVICCLRKLKREFPDERW